MLEYKHDPSVHAYRHPVITMARANLNSWLHSPRTLFMLFFIVALCYIQARGFALTQSHLPYTMNWAESRFYVLSVGVNIPLSSILFLATINELPQRISFQSKSLIRSSRTKWIWGQIMYCLMMSLMMVLLIYVFVSLFMLTAASTHGGGWSETKAILDGYVNEKAALVPVYVREHFTPLTGSVLACIPLVFFWFTMSLVVLGCSLMGVPLLGVLTYVFLLMANVIIYVEFFPWLSVPVQYATLRVMLLSSNVEQRMLKTLMLYLATDGMLIAGMVWRVKKSDLCY